MSGKLGSLCRKSEKQIKNTWIPRREKTRRMRKKQQKKNAAMLDAYERLWLVACTPGPNRKGL